MVIVDEAAFVDAEIFKDAIEPTVSAVNGKIILSSTPKGQSGFFWELFDPENIKESHEYERFWFYWQMVENAVQKRIIEAKLKDSRETGNTKSFDQEYNALFTVDQEAFFMNADIEKNAKKEFSQEYESDLPCSIGLDYGMVNSETSITVVARDKNTIKLLFQFSQAELDDNLLTDNDWEHSIQNLIKRYPNTEHVVVDDCAQGHRTNTELETLGYPVFRFDFRSDKTSGQRNRGYYRFRTALKMYLIKYPWIPQLISQMKSLQETKLEIFTRIKGPRNYLDDRIDSFMMACYPFLVEDGSFGSSVVDYDKAVIKLKNEKKPDGRTDSEWDTFKHKENPYLFEEQIQENEV